MQSVSPDFLRRRLFIQVDVERFDSDPRLHIRCLKTSTYDVASGDCQQKRQQIG